MDGAWNQTRCKLKWQNQRIIREKMTDGEECGTTLIGMA